MTFKELKLTSQYLRALEELDFTEPTPIQEKAIPPIRSGQDVIGIAQTGTGKTAAYLLPLLMKVKYAQDREPRALILVPTRELVLQLLANIEELAKYTDLRYGGIYGGTGKKAQIELLQNGVDIIVGTPGRLTELYLQQHLVLKKVKTFVLDEVDRMLDMGFINQVKDIVGLLPSKKQILMFSATLHPKVEELCLDLIKHPTKIEIARQATPIDTISQSLYTTPNISTKLNLLTHILQDEEKFNKVMIFVTKRENARRIFEHLQGNIKGRMGMLHSNKDQNARINAINAFRNEELRILITTDVSARGIDINLVSHVINFDVPVIYEDYVHRIGRTGRAQQKGEAITFMNEAEEYHIRKIEKLIRMKIPTRKIPKTVEIPETPKEELQDMRRAIDVQKRRENPDFKGAFHEKQRKKGKKGKIRPKKKW